MLALLAATSPAARADPVLGVQDDTVFIDGTPAHRDQLLAAIHAHNATFVHTIAYPDRDLGPWLGLAHSAQAHGLALHVVLALPFQLRQLSITQAKYVSWAASAAAQLQSTGVDLRLSLLNEPDILLVAGYRCDTASEVKASLRAGGLSSRDSMVAVPRTRIVWRVAARNGRAVVVRKLVPVYRWIRRDGRRVWIQAVDWRPKSLVTSTTGTADDSPAITAKRACLALTRAQTASDLLQAAMPAVRAAAPGIPIDIGETSPRPGVDTFIAELGRAGVPRADGFTHHPYCWGDPGFLGCQRLDDLRRDVTAAFGPLPIGLTEFGVPVRRHNPWADQVEVAQSWTKTYAEACRVGATSLVAYQWEPSADSQTGPWDTGILGDDGRESLGSQTFANLHC